MELTQISKSGIAVLIASAVLENEKAGFDPTTRIFEKHDLEDEARIMSVDDHSGYELSKRQVGVFKYESAVVVLFLCNSKEEQKFFGKAEKTKLQNVPKQNGGWGWFQTAREDEDEVVIQSARDKQVKSKKA